MARPRPPGSSGAVRRRTGSRRESSRTTIRSRLAPNTSDRPTRPPAYFTAFVTSSETTRATESRSGRHRVGQENLATSAHAQRLAALT